MKGKYFIAMLCLLVMITQILPLKQIGAMLSGNQMSEEIPHSSDDSKDGIAKIDFSKCDPFILHHSTYSYLFLATLQEFMRINIALPAWQAGERPTPPPDTTV